MTPHQHWLRNYTPHRVAVRLANDQIVYSEGVGSVVFAAEVQGEVVRELEFTRVLHVLILGVKLDQQHALEHHWRLWDEQLSVLRRGEDYTPGGCGMSNWGLRHKPPGL